MRVLHWVMGFALACVGTVAAISGTATADSKEQCVFGDSKEVADGMSYSFENKCDEKMACSIEWTVVCTPKKGKKTEHKYSKNFSMARDTNYAVKASAKVCGDDEWSIERVKWRCKEAK